MGGGGGGGAATGEAGSKRSKAGDAAAAGRAPVDYATRQERRHQKVDSDGDWADGFIICDARPGAR